MYIARCCFGHKVIEKWEDYCPVTILRKFNVKIYFSHHSTSPDFFRLCFSSDHSKVDLIQLMGLPSIRLSINYTADWYCTSVQPKPCYVCVNGLFSLEVLIVSCHFYPYWFGVFCVLQIIFWHNIKRFILDLTCNLFQAATWA